MSFLTRVLALTAAVLVLSAAPALAAVDPASGNLPRPTAADRQVLVSELANGGPGGTAQTDDDFAEIKNWGTTPVDVSGWKLYTCTQPRGDRVTTAKVTIGAGTTLAPGQTFTFASSTATLGGATPDARYTGSVGTAGNSDYGWYVEDENRIRIDSIASGPRSPFRSISDCSSSGSEPDLPNTLNAIAGDSWQRVSNTGDQSKDWIRGLRTPAAPNTTTPYVPFSHRGGIYVDELTAASGPSGGPSNDGFVELKNYGSEAVDISGWKSYKCITSGRLLSTYLQATIPAGTSIAPGDTYTLGHRTGFSGGFGTGPGKAQAMLATTFDKKIYGTALQAADGEFVAGAAISTNNTDSACQEGTTKLPNTIDYSSNESWQRVSRTGDALTDWVLAPRTPNAPNATATDSVMAKSQVGHGRDGVRVSELATDPDTGLPPGSPRNNFIELANYGSAPVDVSNWKIRTCAVDGTRTFAPAVTIASGTTLQPGQTYLAARAGTTAATAAQATYATPLDLTGTGVWLSDASDDLVDNVSMLSRAVSDNLNDPASPCTQGRSLTTYIPDRPAGETWQRSRFTGDNTADFQVGTATPGVRDEQTWLDPTVPLPGATTPVAVPTSHPSDTPVATSTRADGTDTITATLADTDGDALDGVVRGGRRIDLRTHLQGAFTGASDAAPLAGREGTDETAVSAATLAAATTASPVVSSDDGYAYPYQRFVLNAGSGADELQAGTELVWTGATEGRNELQLYVWNTGDSAWRLVDAQVASKQGRVTLVAPLQAGDISGGRADVLVQDGPRTKPTLRSTITPKFQDPGTYDFSFVHFTDAQYLTESYPQRYTGAMSWILANRDARKIDFVANTGDIIQNYVLGGQSRIRATDEYERASKIQKLLDDAGVPNSVLPGNHDSQIGRDNSLFNRYFPPSRYAGKPYYGGSVAPDDNSTNYTTFSKDGAKFVVLSLAYSYTQKDLEWAKDVVTSHRDANIIIATHEHLLTKDDTKGEGAVRAPDPTGEQGGRWNSRGDVLWSTVVAPNRNVVMVLSGHYTGVGKIVTENAGGLPGHTVVEMVADYQEHRSNDGARDTGFDRLLQFDLASGTVAVNTYSQPLNAFYSNPFDYGIVTTGVVDGPAVASNERPWNLLATGTLNRSTEIDDQFNAKVGLQYAKSVRTDGVELAAAPADLGTATVTGSGRVQADWPASASAPLTADRVWWAAATDQNGARVASAPAVNAADHVPDPPADTTPTTATTPVVTPPATGTPTTPVAPPATPKPPVEVKAFARKGTPKVTGRAKVGKRLKVALKKAFSPKSTKVTYRWYRGGKAIKGATRTTYRVAKADRGKKLTARVTATRAGYRTTTVVATAGRAK